MAHFYGFSIQVPRLSGVISFLGRASAAGNCTLFVRLRDMTGKPHSGQRIIFYEPANTPIEGPSQEIITDEHGYAEISLEYDREVEVSFLGTSFLRRIVVPSVAMADLLQVAQLDGFDTFTIVRPDPIPAIRRS